jgi:hypothetical protein
MNKIISRQSSEEQNLNTHCHCKLEGLCSLLRSENLATETRPDIAEEGNI